MKYGNVSTYFSFYIKETKQPTPSKSFTKG